MKIDLHHLNIFILTHFKMPLVKICGESYDTDTTIKLDISGKNLKSLPPELLKFTNLFELDCSNNQITSLDNLPPNLEKLDCSNNYLQHLNVPPKLKYLYCEYNSITRLDNIPFRIIRIICNNNKFSFWYNMYLNIRYFYC